ncbi:protein-arginine deiminase [Calothrix sp. NIES-4071]|nr:protein-arginine deiminase [Calothrix sp. NIES-4071]BAZ55226.1 protein-arginine deiminase [Calothrix sp. NIES-4105]
MNFVGAASPKGFKLILASPNKCYDLLKRLRDEGHSQILLRQGKQLDDKPADISIADVLDNEDLAIHNQRFQEYINWNREVLKQELGLDEEDISEFSTETFEKHHKSPCFIKLTRWLVGFYKASTRPT